MLDYRIHYAKLMADDRLRAATAHGAQPSRIHRQKQSPSERSRAAR